MLCKNVADVLHEGLCGDDHHTIANLNGVAPAGDDDLALSLIHIFPCTKVRAGKRVEKGEEGEEG